MNRMHNLNQCKLWLIKLEFTFALEKPAIMRCVLVVPELVYAGIITLADSAYSATVVVSMITESL